MTVADGGAAPAAFGHLPYSVGDGHLFQGIPGEEHVATSLAGLQTPSKDTSTWHRSGAAFVHLPTSKELSAIVKGVDPHGVLAPCRNGIGREDQ